MPMRDQIASLIMNEVKLNPKNLGLFLYISPIWLKHAIAGWYTGVCD